MSKWISVDEILPPIEEPVLCTDGRHYAVLEYMFDEWWVAEGLSGPPNFCGTAADVCCDFEPTHWTPLPKIS
jgi:hypothetical protein